MSLKIGDIVRFERTFTLNDVELFIKISGDEGIHHMYLRGNIIITKKSSLFQLGNGLLFIRLSKLNDCLKVFAKV